MPRSPGRQCKGAGARHGVCTQLVYGKAEYCEECEPEVKRLVRKYDKKRDQRPERKFLGSAAWAKMRKIKLNANPLCERCFHEGIVKAATLVHHRDHDELNNHFSNHESLCAACHNREHGWGGKG
jgi:5-methylcytosine-specific restriction enzyme A